MLAGTPWRVVGRRWFPPLRRWCTEGSAAIQDASPRQPAPLILVLDLDETLVRVACDGVHRRKLKNVDFNMSVDIGDPPESYNCKVRRRPGLDTFFEWIQERRRAGLLEGPWLFTTSAPVYTKALLRHIDPGGRVFGLRVLARRACQATATPGFMLKDLSRVPCKSNNAESRKILVDNNPVSLILNPGSAILVRDWLGQDPEDNELARVQATLDLLIRKAVDLGQIVNGHTDAANYTEHLSGLAPRAHFHERLQALGAKLESGPSRDIPLREALRAVTTECNAIKKEHLGAAP